MIGPANRPDKPCHGPFHAVKLHLAPKISVSRCHVAGIWQGECTKLLCRERRGHAPICQSWIAGDGARLQKARNRGFWPLVSEWSCTQSGKRISPDQAAPHETHLDDHAAQIARFRCMVMKQLASNISPFATYHISLASMDVGPGALSGITHHLSATGPLVPPRAVVAVIYSDLGTGTPRHPQP